MPRRGSERAKYAQSHEISRHAGAHLQSARMRPAEDTVTEATRRYLAGEISWDEVERINRQYAERRERAQEARASGRRAPDPRRDRPAPDESRQWSRPMTTRAARDDRLTPQAKALLQIIVAEIGDRGRRMLATEYLARRIKRSVRQTRRYLAQLRDRGYIETERVRSERTGLDIGKAVAVVAQAVRPFWHPARRSRSTNRGMSGRTHLSSTNTAERCNDQAPDRKAQSEGDSLGTVLARLGTTLRDSPG